MKPISRFKRMYLLAFFALSIISILSIKVKKDNKQEESKIFVNILLKRFKKIKFSKKVI